MYIIKNIMIINAIACTTFSLAMLFEEMPNPAQWFDQPVTPETILFIIPPLPEDHKKIVDTWMSKWSNKSLILKITEKPTTVSNQILLDTIKNNNEFIKNHGSTNLSHLSYVFSLPSDNNNTLMLKCTALIHIICSLITTTGHDPYEKPLLDFDLSTLDMSKSTYQRISEPIYAAIVQKVIEKYNLKLIMIPPTFLYHLPKRSTHLSDENYCVVQEALPNLVPFKSLTEKERFDALDTCITRDHLAELYRVTREAALWGLSFNLMLDPVNKKLAIVDLQQRNNCNPEHFFYQGTEGSLQYIVDIKKGLSSFSSELFDIDLAEQAFWKNLMHKDIIFNPEKKEIL